MQSCLFLGLDKETKAYHLYEQTHQKVIISRDVVFDKNKVGYKYLINNNRVDENYQILVFEISTTKATAKL